MINLYLLIEINRTSIKSQVSKPSLRLIAWMLPWCAFYSYSIVGLWIVDIVILSCAEPVVSRIRRAERRNDSVSWILRTTGWSGNDFPKNNWNCKFLWSVNKSLFKLLDCRKVMNITKHYIKGKRIRIDLTRPRIGRLLHLFLGIGQWSGSVFGPYSIHNRWPSRPIANQQQLAAWLDFLYQYSYIIICRFSTQQWIKKYFKFKPALTNSRDFVLF